MGHHRDSEGRFQSDLHPDLRPDRVQVNMGRARSWPCVISLAAGYMYTEPSATLLPPKEEFAEDLADRLEEIILEREDVDWIAVWESMADSSRLLLDIHVKWKKKYPHKWRKKKHHER